MTANGNPSGANSLPAGRKLMITRQFDARPGGACRVVTRSPEGQGIPNPGAYRAAVENARLVFTDAHTRAREPSDKPLMTAIIALAARHKESHHENHR